MFSSAFDIRRFGRVEIKNIKTEDYPIATRRPRYSVLSKSKIKRDFNLKIRGWDEALEYFLVFLKEYRKGLGGRVEK